MADMNSFKVLVSDPLSEQGTKMLQDAGVQVDIRTKQSEDELVAIIGDYEGLIVRSQTEVTRRIFEAATKLRIVGRAGVGIDNIDVNAATEKGVVVVNAPEGNTIAATEHTIGLMLALARNIPQADRLLRMGKWERKRFMGVELRNKVLGIIGLGKIGSEVAKRARALEMRVIAYDPYVSHEWTERIGVELVAFEEVLAKADFLTVHLPLSPSTFHMIGEEQLAKTKAGVRILNVARGGIIDEEALAKALKSGHVAGAAIDVFEHEPAVESPLFEADSVVVTPHLGASTEEAQVSVAIEVAEDFLRVFRGEPAKNPVNIPSVKPELMAAISPYLDLAERLGRFMAQIMEDNIQAIEVRYNGDLAALETTPITNTLLKGFLRPMLQDAVNYVNAPIVAKNRGLQVSEKKSVQMEDFANLVTLVVKGKEGEERSLAGTLLTNKEPRIVRIDGYSVDAVPQGHMLVVPHIDKPKIIGPVANLIGAHEINIAGMQVGRKTIGGRAVMLLSLDSPVPTPTLEEIKKIPGVLGVRYVYL